MNANADDVLEHDGRALAVVNAIRHEVGLDARKDARLDKKELLQVLACVRTRREIIEALKARERQ